MQPVYRTNRAGAMRREFPANGFELDFDFGFELDPRRVFFFIFLIFFSFARLIKYINRYILSTFKYIRA